MRKRGGILEPTTRQSIQIFVMGPDGRPLLERYSDLLAERNSTALDYAFLVGYQCAFRFLMMGLFPATGAFLKEEVS